MKKIFEFLQNPEGDLSMKRLFALGAFAVAIVLAFTVKSTALVGLFLGAATLALGLGAITKT